MWKRIRHVRCNSQQHVRPSCIESLAVSSTKDKRMKNWNWLSIALIGLLALSVLSSCGNSGTATSGTATTLTATCSTGYVYSATYGCLAQSTCSSGYGLYNNQCVYLGTTATTTTCPTGYTLYSNQCIASSTSTVNSCGVAGYTPTPYGCLPQYYCAVGFGYLNGYCLNASGQYYRLGY